MLQRQRVARIGKRAMAMASSVRLDPTAFIFNYAAAGDRLTDLVVYNGHSASSALPRGNDGKAAETPVTNMEYTSCLAADRRAPKQ
jgi:hypothetical protein